MVPVRIQPGSAIVPAHGDPAQLQTGSTGPLQGQTPASGNIWEFLKLREPAGGTKQAWGSRCEEVEVYWNINIQITCKIEKTQQQHIQTLVGRRR